MLSAPFNFINMQRPGISERIGIFQSDYRDYCLQKQNCRNALRRANSPLPEAMRFFFATQYPFPHRFIIESNLYLYYKYTVYIFNLHINCWFLFQIGGSGGRGMFCYHCPPALHPGAPQPRLPTLEYPFTPSHPCENFNYLRKFDISVGKVDV